ncbi:MAG: carboxypeptidase-like regulatory domain-containing protein, partial [Bryobacteraceae bacterium]
MRVRLAFIIVLAATMAGSLLAQTNTGSIGGTVKDATGAVMTGVRIDVTNTATGVKRAVQTNEVGLFLASS